MLVVDDDPVQRASLEMLLTARGAIVHTVPDGFGAIEAYLATSIDVIVMDLRMPDMWGDEACEAIRMFTESAQPVVVGCSSLANGPERARRAGMDGYVGKPVAGDCLIDEIVRCLHRAR
ncbi:response regulator [Propionivibrio sp.]|uniref:response regulator n=1 Tax=Propionivibrio sp. TaxID=2212460 RepID=UPI0039E292A9